VSFEDPLATIRNSLKYSVRNGTVKDEAQRFLNKLASVFQGYYLPREPLLKFFRMDNGSILFEWVSRSCRLGFSVDADPDESGWFLVTRELQEQGTMEELDLERVIEFFLQQQR
jgi:hypothetical protein